MAITPLMPVYPRSPVRPVRGEGVYLYRRAGRAISRFRGGIAVNLLGHGHPHLTKAIQEQAATLMHVSNLYGSPQGEALRAAAGRPDLRRHGVLHQFGRRGGRMRDQDRAPLSLSPSGNPHKHELITFSNAFHGRTMATISATDQPKMRDGFAPLLPGFTVVEFDDLEAAHGGDRRRTPPASWSSRSRARAASARRRRNSSQGLRAACDEHDLMLVLDEVQCGVARTGKLYAYEHYGIDARHHGHRPRASAAASRWAPASRPRRRRAAW